MLACRHGHLDVVKVSYGSHSVEQLQKEVFLKDFSLPEDIDPFRSV